MLDFQEAPASALTDRPHWVTLSDADAQKARRIITPAFWNSDTPFFQPAYSDIGFPLVVGALLPESINDIYKSEIYEGLQDGDSRGLIDDFNIDQLSEFPFLIKACQQIIAADRYIFGQENIAWFFSIDIQELRENKRQRSLGGRHYDSHLDCYPHVETLAEAFRKGGEASANSQFFPHHIHTGVTRHYVTADRRPTLFAGRDPFKPLQLVLYVAEEHESPVLPESCIRVFLRGKATPTPA